MSRAVERVSDVLMLVARSPRPLDVGQISQALDIPRSTTYDLVGSLIDCGLLRWDTDAAAKAGGVAPGLGLFELGSAYLRSIDFTRDAQAAATRLSRLVGETSHVGILDRGDIVYLAKEDGEGAVRMASAVGRRIPAHSSGLGKALLAFLDPQKLEEFLTRDEPLAEVTANTITDPALLRVELGEVRSSGYAFDDRESSPDIQCVGCPVRDHTGYSIAGISASVPASRMSTAFKSELVESVTLVAVELSMRLGFQG